MVSLSLNHAVLFVSNLEKATAFYTDVLGFKPLADVEGLQAAFFTAPGSSNHHDLGLFQTPGSKAPRGSVGLYHLAWEVEKLADVVELRDALVTAGSLTGQSHHGVTISIYAADPDGNEFEIMWTLPRDAWGEYADKGVVMPLDLEAELERWG